MKIVVFGPNKRTGVLRGQEISDISGSYAKYLHEKEGRANAYLIADALAPSDLGRLIEGGQQALDNIDTALDHLVSGDPTGLRGEPLVFKAGDVKLHAPRASNARVACAGGNFAQHAEAMAQRRVERGEASPFTEGSAREYVRNRGFWGFWKVDRESGGQHADYRTGGHQSVRGKHRLSLQQRTHGFSCRRDGRIREVCGWVHQRGSLGGNQNQKSR